MSVLHALDWVVVAVYAAAVVGIGWLANRRQKDSEDYFLGGRRLRWWAVGVSLIATSFSGVSLIAGTGFGYARGMRWLQLQIGDLLAIVLVCVVFLPFFSRLRLTTAYEYLERRFGVVARTAASLLFLGQTLLRTAILIYAPALALATLLGWSLTSAIVATAAVAILYSVTGGISAVVWTDLIQMCVILFAVGYSLSLLAGDVPGGLGAILDHAGRAGRLETVSCAPEPESLHNLLGALVPYAVLAFSLFGTGQQAVQRFLSCTDLAAARKAALMGWFVGTLALAMTLFLGACLFSWEALGPGTLEMAGERPDQVLPAFIRLRLPAGLRGLMLAAIFAASMSSIDSAIHSMSTAAIVDFVRRFARRRPAARTELRVARAATALFGVLAVAGALQAARRQGTTILDTLVTWLGYFAGPLLGLFLLGLLTRRANQRGALTGAGLAFAGTVVSVFSLGDRSEWGFHPLWLAPLSCAATLILGLGASLLWAPPDPVRLRGLTWRDAAPGPGSAPDRARAPEGTETG